MSYFGIGIWHPKSECNIGTLFRSAYAFGASFCFVIGRRYKRRSSDTVNVTNQIPLYEYLTLDELKLPKNCPLVGVELTKEARNLRFFCHPRQAIYLLGAEDHGLSPEVLNKCHLVVQIPDLRCCLNVASMATLVLYDRWSKQNVKLANNMANLCQVSTD